MIDLWRTWTAAGFDPDRFPRQTLRSYSVAIQGARQRQRQEDALQRRLAWMTAALTRARKLPDLGAWSNPPATRAERQRQTIEAFREMSRMLATRRRAGNAPRTEDS